MTLAVEQDIRDGGKELTLTLSGASWKTFDDTIRQAIIDGLDSAGAEASGWDAIVKAGLTPSDVTRTSNYVATITLPAFPTYDITADEQITATVPTTALNSGLGPVATPVFTVQFVEDNIPGGWGALNYYDSYLQRKRRRDDERRQIAEELGEIPDQTDREIARLLHKQMVFEQRSQEIAELEDLVNQTNVNREAKKLKELNEDLARTYTRAYMQGNFSAVEAFEREMESYIEEEEFLLLAMSLL